MKKVKLSFEQQAHAVFLAALERTGKVGKASEIERAWRQENTVSDALYRMDKKTLGAANKKQLTENNNQRQWAHKSLIQQLHCPVGVRPVLSLATKMKGAMHRLSTI